MDQLPDAAQPLDVVLGVEPVPALPRRQDQAVLLVEPQRLRRRPHQLCRHSHGVERRILVFQYIQAIGYHNFLTFSHVLRIVDVSSVILSVTSRTPMMIRMTPLVILMALKCFFSLLEGRQERADGNGRKDEGDAQAERVEGQERHAPAQGIRRHGKRQDRSQERSGAGGPAGAEDHADDDRADVPRRPGLEVQLRLPLQERDVHHVHDKHAHDDDEHAADDPDDIQVLRQDASCEARRGPEQDKDDGEPAPQRQANEAG